MPIAEQLDAIHERAATLIRDQYTCLNERIMPELAAHGRAPAVAGPVDAGAARLAGKLLPQRGRAGAEPAGPRSGPPLSAHPEQEPQLHRPARRARTPSAATPTWPSCRCRARCRAWCPCRRKAAARPSCCCRTSWPSSSPLLFPGHGGARLLPVPGHAQQRPVRRRRGSRRPAPRAGGRAGASPLRRIGAAGDLGGLPGGSWRTSCWSSSG